MALDVVGLATVSLFYLLILIVGVWAARRLDNLDNGSSGTESLLLAKRNLGTLIGTFTMTATWVGGGYVISSAEGAFSNGLVWCQAPFGYGLSLILAGLFFAKPMRNACYETIIDPFQQTYGQLIGGLLFVPVAFAEICWTSAILSALGFTLSSVLDLDLKLAVVTSSTITALYTLTGGLYSVAVTDVAQLLAIGVGLVTCIPFVMTNEAVDGAALKTGTWAGVVEYHNIGVYIENYLLIIIGGIPWQVYFQRVLACRSAARAQSASLFAGLATFLFSGPPICLGLLARVTDWETATKGILTAEDVHEQKRMILPLVLQYLTPKWISYIGLMAISAAVMSSIDSAILSTSSMFATNIYRSIFFPQVSDTHLVRVIRLAIVIITGLTSLIALQVNSIYGLYVLGLDLVYVVVFPQLLLVLYWNEHCNSYGCLAGLATGITLRILGGEPLLGLSPIVTYPFYSEKLGQLFPFRTTSMIAALMTQVIASYSAAFLFRRVLPKSCDFLRCFGPAASTVGEQRHQCRDLNNKHSAGSAPSSDLFSTRASTDKELLPSKSLNLVQRTIRIPRAIFRKGSNRYTRKDCGNHLESLHL